MQQAGELLLKWVNAQNLKGATTKLYQDQGKTPLLYAEVEGHPNYNKSIVLYGHFDKQPHGKGWDEEYGPLSGKIKDGKLYGRGSSDDGYATFASILLIKALQQFNIPHPKFIMFIEADEETDSADLPYYFKKFEDRIGEPEIIACLDSGCGNYEQLWMTNSLRGVMNVNLRVDVIEQGKHSGDVGGMVPSSFRILRSLLERFENANTGDIADFFKVSIPPIRYQELHQVSQVLGEHYHEECKFVEGTQPVCNSTFENFLNRTWRPAVNYIGIDGVPSC